LHRIGGWGLFIFTHELGDVQRDFRGDPVSLAIEIHGRGQRPFEHLLRFLFPVAERQVRRRRCWRTTQDRSRGPVAVEKRNQTLRLRQRLSVVAPLTDYDRQVGLFVLDPIDRHIRRLSGDSISER
jgi:hypothetical protein